MLSRMTPGVNLKVLKIHTWGSFLRDRASFSFEVTTALQSGNGVLNSIIGVRNSNCGVQKPNNAVQNSDNGVKTLNMGCKKLLKLVF